MRCSIPLEKVPRVSPARALEADQLEGLGDAPGALAAGDAVEGGVEVQELLGPQPLVEAELLGEEAQAPPGLRRRPGGARGAAPGRRWGARGPPASSPWWTSRRRSAPGSRRPRRPGRAGRASATATLRPYSLRSPSVSTARGRSAAGPGGPAAARRGAAGGGPGGWGRRRAGDGHGARDLAQGGEGAGPDGLLQLGRRDAGADEDRRGRRP